MPATVVPGERPPASGSMVVVSEGASTEGAGETGAGEEAGAEAGLGLRAPDGEGCAGEEPETCAGEAAEAEPDAAGPGVEGVEGMAGGVVFDPVPGWSGDAQAPQNRDESGFDVRQFGQSKWYPFLFVLTIAPIRARVNIRGRTKPTQTFY